MPSNVYQEWLNRNSSRKYPFADDADLSCRGGLVLPNSLVLDARVCVIGDSDGDVLVTAVSVSKVGVSVEFLVSGLDGEPGQVRVSTTPSGRVSTYRSHALDIRVVVPHPDEIQDSLKDGVFSLVSPVEFLPGRVVRLPWGSGCNTLSCGGLDASGDVKLLDGHNTTLRIYGNKLVLRVKMGLGKGPLCEKTASSPDGEESMSRPVYYINGQKADSDGGFQIYGGDGVTVSTGMNQGIPAVFVKSSAEFSRM